MTRDELAELAGRYHAALWGAKSDAVTILLTRLSVHYWQPDRPAQHWDILLADYLEDLCRYPLDLINDAIADYRRHGGQFFPKVSDLIERIQPKHDQRLADLAEIERLIEQRSRVQAAMQAAKPTIADKDEVSRLVKEARRHLSA